MPAANRLNTHKSHRNSSLTERKKQTGQQQPSNMLIKIASNPGHRSSRKGRPQQHFQDITNQPKNHLPKTSTMANTMLSTKSQPATTSGSDQVPRAIGSKCLLSKKSYKIKVFTEQEINIKLQKGVCELAISTTKMP